MHVGPPEVLRVVISEALMITSGKNLSWNVWDNGEITSVKPEVVDAPIQSEIVPHAPQPATLIRVTNMKSQPPDFEQLIRHTRRANRCLNDCTLKLLVQAYIACERTATALRS